ncbi:hypothetical protein CV102_16410 [Natronococcus pandeyae]|uniref:Uncharacterized protein n=1 Tax=Natronococcus pandeyae TaxID=2055836 RepID=A0A8J8PZX1_9EURY|nr:hypothetical protein [Natronococcus pandeyae]TYL37550.1 hypothetical protein CV102_16410 [Natronococcus pandeyae]
MTSTVLRIALSAGFVVGVTAGHFQLLLSYGGLIAAYVSEMQFLLVSFLGIALSTWILLSVVPIETEVFVPIAVVLPLVGGFSVHVAQGGGSELHPAVQILLVGYVLSFLAGLGLRQLLARRGDRGDRVVAPIARRKRELVAGGALLLLGGAVVSAARQPTVAISETRTTNEHASVSLEVEVETTDPASLRLVLETPAETFDGWIPRSDIENGVGTGTVRLARPSATPPVGGYDLRIETVWRRTVATASFDIEDGPLVDVVGVSVGRSDTDFGTATSIAFDVENDGDAPGVVWDHSLEIDGEPHRVMHETAVIHPDESATIGGPIGTHSADDGRWEPTLLEEGEYALVLQLESLEQTLLTYETTVEVDG